MQNIWSYFGDGCAYWHNKKATLEFGEAVKEERKFLIFDLETTGLKKNADVIVEFSAAIAEKVNEKYKITETVEYFIKPPFQMSEEVIAIHGITNEFLKDKPTEEEIFEEIKAFFDKHADAVIMGYNVSFDIKFMEVMYKRQKSTFGPEEVIDAFDMVKENIFSDEHGGSRKLSDMLPMLCPAKNYQFHDSSDDILATWDVAVAVFSRFVQSKLVPEECKYHAKLVSYQYWSMHKTQRLYCTVKMDDRYFEIYYDIFQSCWVCETKKNDDINIFLYINMDDVEEQFTNIALEKGKKKFRLLRDSSKIA